MSATKEISQGSPETAEHDFSVALSSAATVTPDYSAVLTPARIAIYDDFHSVPRIVEVSPSTTNEFIENLTTNIYTFDQQCGGSIPYTVIREVTENFIHANFREIVVSIFDNGNTIRFSDQGPGIQDKESATFPGFTSANESMKKYIRGVGSGLPIVKEYFEFSKGHVTIQDNLNTGAVVTISLVPKKQQPSSTNVFSNVVIPSLTPREKSFLLLFASKGALGVTELHNLTNTPNATVSNTLKKLTDAGLIKMSPIGKKRSLTDLGREISEFI